MRKIKGDCKTRPRLFHIIFNILREENVTEIEKHKLISDGVGFAISKIIFEIIE